MDLITLITIVFDLFLICLSPKLRRLFMYLLLAYEVLFFIIGPICLLTGLIPIVIKHKKLAGITCESQLAPKNLSNETNLIMDITALAVRGQQIEHQTCRVSRF